MLKGKELPLCPSVVAALLGTTTVGTIANVLSATKRSARRVKIVLRSNFHVENPTKKQNGGQDQKLAAVLKRTIVADSQVAGHIGSFGRDGNARLATGSTAHFGDATLPAKRSLRFFAWNKRGRSTPVWPHTTLRRCASCKNVASPYARARPIRTPSSSASRIFFSRLQRQAEVEG